MADTQIKERPILFSGPMVRALLDGRKTQTRRLVKKWFFAKGYEGLNLDFSGLVPTKVAPDFWHLSSRGEGGCWNERAAAFCPHGTIGDRLWVRETFFAWGYWTKHYSGELGRDLWHFNDLTTEGNYRFERPEGTLRRVEGGIGWFKRPSIFIPRAASRITLEITDVRVARLQDISEADALAEGCEVEPMAAPDTFSDPQHRALAKALGPGEWTAKFAYMQLWDDIHGEDAWSKNPWVWAVSFRRLEVR